MGKNKMPELQPWLDYFNMLQTYENKGYLEVAASKHEAYITRAALMTLCSSSDLYMIRRNDLRVVVHNVRSYAVWKASVSQVSVSVAEYADVPFALHVVKEAMPHDPLFILLLKRRRRWFIPWLKTDCISLIRI